MEEDRKAAEAKRKLQEKDSEIRKLQDEIAQLKAKMRKNNIKANYTAEKSETKEKSKDKPKPPPKTVKNPNQKSISDQTHLKYDEKGLAIEKGVRFTDVFSTGFYLITDFVVTLDTTNGKSGFLGPDFNGGYAGV